MIHLRTTPGFTLVETLIAVSIVTFSIVGPLHVVQGILQASFTARDQLLASALAQEGMEYVHSVRDANYLYNLHNSGTRQWLYGVDGSTYGGSPSPDCYTNACVVDVGQQTVASCGNSTCTGRPLYLSASNLYTQVTTGVQTRFTRKVQLINVSPTETAVVVTVSWTGHGSYSVVLRENLRNWL